MENIHTNVPNISVFNINKTRQNPQFESPWQLELNELSASWAAKRTRNFNKRIWNRHPIMLVIGNRCQTSMTRLWTLWHSQKRAASWMLQPWVPCGPCDLDLDSNPHWGDWNDDKYLTSHIDYSFTLKNLTGTGDKYEAWKIPRPWFPWYDIKPCFTFSKPKSRQTPWHDVT